MNFVQAVDDYLMHLEVEKNYSKNTIIGYAFDLKCYEHFLRSQNRSLELDDLTPSTSRRFIQDQVLNHNTKPKTMQRRISCLKSLSQFCLKENYMNADFMAGIQAPKNEKKLPVYMSLEELQKLFRFLEQDTRQSVSVIRFSCLFDSGIPFNP